MTRVPEERSRTPQRGSAIWERACGRVPAGSVFSHGLFEEDWFAVAGRSSCALSTLATKKTLLGRSRTGKSPSGNTTQHNTTQHTVQGCEKKQFFSCDFRKKTGQEKKQGPLNFRKKNSCFLRKKNCFFPEISGENPENHTLGPHFFRARFARRRI